MNAERFAQLADAYGGDIGRWPEGEQVAARMWSSANVGAAHALEEARTLDAFLDAAAPVAPGPMLRERIIALAPRGALRGVRTWMSGAGLAAACAAGVLLGMNYSDRVLTDPAADAVAEAATIFDGAAYLEMTETTG